MSATLYYSRRCPNCTRFLSAAARVPDLPLRVVDVDASPGAAQMVTAVPTVVTDGGGGSFVGSKAFEWLGQFQDRTELEHWSGSGGGLAWSSFGDDADGYVQHTEAFSAFEPPE